MDASNRTVIVRDRKDPRHKTGNDQKVPLLDVTGYDAMALLEAQKAACSSRGRIFPYNARSVGTAFRRTCRALGIPDIHFHDLRHEGTSRLFEAGLDIPRVALVTGHKDWKMLRRYTNLSPSDLHRRLSASKPPPSDSAASPAQQAFSAAMALMVQDAALGGASRFRGTSILVDPVAELLQRGVSETTLLSDFPLLTPDMIIAARIYVALKRTSAAALAS